jgi:anti-sigma B factor antagonist
MTAVPVSFSIADSSVGPRKVVIWVTGDLDADTSRAVRARLAQARHHASSEVILDLTGVTFVDSEGLGEIVTGAKQMEDLDKLQVIAPPEAVARVFNDAGLGEVFELTPDRRGEARDRRRERVPVDMDRRRGDRRHFPSDNDPGEGPPAAA